MALVILRYTPPTSGEHLVGICADFTGWRIVDLINDAGVYHREFDLQPGRYLYKFIVDGVWMTDPANPEREPDPFGTFNSVLDLGRPDHRIKNVKPDSFPVPQWVQEGIIYQIFVDRFYNGDPDNDPDFSEDYYSKSKQAPPKGQYLNANQEYYHLVRDWTDIKGLRQSPWLPKGKPDWWSFYGGDLRGVIEKLDYLTDLGITIIYFNPLWKAKSNHKYDSADYKSIDPHFGTEQDLQELVSKAHSRGIKIILDVAFNHTGETFWAFRDCIQKGPDSQWWTWYDWQKWPLPDPLPTDFQPKDYYQCWWGIKDMPDLNYDLSRPHPEENTIRNINEAAPNTSLIDYLKSVVRYWIGEMDLDGFRLDVPDEVPYWFWELFRSWVKEIKADAWLVGEIWNNAEQWVSPKYFDSVMNYAYFKSPVHDYFLKESISRTEFIRRMREGIDSYPDQSLKAMMNLLGSHDTWRVNELDEDKQNLVKLAYIFQMVYIGVPHIYYGDEIGMKGSGDPDNRRPFDWNWSSKPFSKDLRSMIKTLISLRKAHPSLIHGELEFIDDSDDCLKLVRRDSSEELLIIFNRLQKPISLDLGYPYKELFSSSHSGSWGNGEIYMGPRSAVILSLEN